MKTIIIQIFTIVFLSFLLLSCEESVPEYDETEYYMHCLLVEGQQPRITLGQTLNVYPEHAFNLVYHREIYDYDISMTRNGEPLQGLKTCKYFVENYNNNYYPLAMDQIPYLTYEDAVIGAGDSYSVQVEVLNLDNSILKILKAETVIPHHIPVELEYIKDGEDGTYLNSVVYEISFTDPADQNNFYYLLPFVVSVPIGMDIKDLNIDSLWDYPENYPDINLHTQKSIMKKIVGLNDYDKTLSSYTTYNNDANYLGYLFNDENFDGEKKTIVFNVDGYYQNIEKDAYLFFQLFHLTEDFYKYYSTVLNQHNTQQDVYSEPVQLYTNVQNGLGLFAGASLTEENILIQPNP